jgi:hypothetical protein
LNATAYKLTSGAFLTTPFHYLFSGFLDILSRYLAAIEFAFSRDKKEDFSAALAVRVRRSYRLAKKVGLGSGFTYSKAARNDQAS